MHKILLVLRNEIRTVILRPSFFITLFLLPIISFIILLVAGFLQRNESDFSLEKVFTPPAAPQMEGFVDLSGLLETLPPNMENSLVRYSSEETALAALEAGKIGAYYIIAADYLDSGSVEYVQMDYNPIGGISQSGQIGYALNYNLLKNQPDLFARINGSLNIREEQLAGAVAGPSEAESPPTETTPQEQENPLTTFTVPYVVMMIFYVVILTSSSLLLNNINTEKRNRTIEILMTSVTPRSLLAGKITALGLVGLLQTLVWTGTGLILLRLSGRALNLQNMGTVSPTLLLWGILFFLLGYAVYASLMAGLGALVPNVREASQVTTVIILPMIVPLIMSSALISQPNGNLATALSLFPLTAPTTMMLRISAGDVPLWQPLLSAALLAGTAFLVIRAAAGMFRAQNLLSGQSINLKRYLMALFGRA